MDCVNIRSIYRHLTPVSPEMQSLSETVGESSLSNPDNVFPLEAVQTEFSGKIEDLSVL
jgi:hypothetical protein